MVTLTTTKAREVFSDTVSRVSYTGERVAVERHGKTVAGIVSAEDLELLQRLEDRADLRAVRAALKEKGPRVAWTDLKKELGL